ncbi:zinc-binding dehydrogenase [Streptomyces sp. NBC_01750]|uniref:zinc-binding dehydrogenase n=1 Tax=Streptomyces sp. NBC_01750 TaxID=2975928 RepID=UPI002DDB3850|nr:zinc-binding dehydrogenase [Streptomyces sp. NBC_01750]WSD33894.1 zinc-binding dehydrogenase [Streptomyces sp. NBC_01750]
MRVVQEEQGALGVRALLDPDQQRAADQQHRIAGHRREGPSVATKSRQGGRRCLRRIADRVAAGTYRVPVEAAFPLERASEAHERLHRRSTRDKIVLTVA